MVHLHYLNNFISNNSVIYAVFLGGSLGLRTGSVGVAFVLYVTSLGLCFGLNGGKNSKVIVIAKSWLTFLLYVFLQRHANSLLVALLV